jgi:ComF family protein
MNAARGWLSSIRRARKAVNLATAGWLTGRCLLCGDPCAQEALCPPCLAGLPGLGPACPRCALPLEAPASPCGACLQRAPPWTAARAALRYEFPVDSLVRKLKYQRQLAAGRALAMAMIRPSATWPGPSRPGAGPTPQLTPSPPPWLVPVPLHWNREAWRGFNQARELCVHLARVTQWPLRDRWLRRVQRTPPQAGMPSGQRKLNLVGAFRWCGPPLSGHRIVLVDDVLTTGATAAACCSALGDADAVELWVAARAVAEPASYSASRAHRS